MAKKRDRGFFVCPRWQEVIDVAARRALGTPTDLNVARKTLTAIENGHPVARSTLRKALFAVRRASGSMFDVDEFIVDQRMDRSRG